METAGGNSPTTPKPEIKPDANGNYTEAQKQQLHEQDQTTSKEQAQQAQDFQKHKLNSPQIQALIRWFQTW